MMPLDAEVAGSGATRPQVVGDQQVRNEGVFLQQLAHELQRGPLVAPGLDQHIEDLAFGVDGASQIDQAAIDLQVDLIEMPRAVGLGRRLRKSAAISGPKWFTQRRMDS